jgi:serpin B
MDAPDAFNAQAANFKGMSDSEGIFIAKVVHKAVVEVGEEGTEAAAATAVINNNRNSVIDFPIDVPVFNCNKPFIFIIHENQNNTILFVGKYSK